MQTIRDEGIRMVAGTFSEHRQSACILHLLRTPPIRTPTPRVLVLSCRFIDVIIIKKTNHFLGGVALRICTLSTPSSSGASARNAALVRSTCCESVLQPAQVSTTRTKMQRSGPLQTETPSVSLVRRSWMTKNTETYVRGRRNTRVCRTSH